MNKGTLIPPKPKEYITYSEQEKIEKTEELYGRIDDIYCRIGEAEEGCRKRIECILQNEANLCELQKVLEAECRILIMHSYEFRVFNEMCRIAQKEELFNEPSVLLNIKNIDDAVYWYKKFVFLLRRSEFGWEDHGELLLYMQQGEISYIFLAELICGNSIVRKTHTACEVAQFLAHNNLIREAVLLLMWLEKQLPYSDRLVMMFAMTMLDMGERKLAYELLIKHRNPNDDIKELQAMLGEVL